MDARTRWPDDRIDDLSSRLGKAENNTARLARLEEQVRAAIKDIEEVRMEVAKLRASIDARRDQDTIERKTDRRWLFGTVISASGIIIAAIALLADKI